MKSQSILLGTSEETESVKVIRYKWVDVSKAMAMIFVYLGHWIT